MYFICRKMITKFSINFVVNTPISRRVAFFEIKTPHMNRMSYVAEETLHQSNEPPQIRCY